MFKYWYHFLSPSSRVLRLVPFAVRTGLALWRVVFFSSGCGRGVVGGVIREMCSCEGWVVRYTLRRELQEGEVKVQHADTVVSSPAPSQILSRSFLHSCKIKSGSGLGMRLLTLHSWSSLHLVSTRGHSSFLKYLKLMCSFKIYSIQWNPSIADTIGDQHFVPYSEVEHSSLMLKIYSLIHSFRPAFGNVSNGLRPGNDDTGLLHWLNWLSFHHNLSYFITNHHILGV